MSQSSPSYMFAGSWLRLCYFHVAPFSFFTFFMLHFFNNEKIWKWTERPDTRHREIVSLLFWYPVTRFLLYSFEWLIKWKGTNLLFSWKRICLPRLETFKTRMWVEFFFSPTWNTLQIFQLCYWEWMHSEKIYSCWKNTRVSMKNKVLSYLFHRSSL